MDSAKREEFERTERQELQRIETVLRQAEANTAVPDEILAAFAVAKYRVSQKWPYAFGGGHDESKPFQPSKDIRPKYASVVGYDCSGIASDCWNRIEGLGHARSTGELLNAGVSGQGEFCTMWVAQYPNVLEHVAIEFKIPSEPTLRWLAAAYTGTLVQFWPYADNWVLQTPWVYEPRRRRG